MEICLKVICNISNLTSDIILNWNDIRNTADVSELYKMVSLNL